VWIFLFFFLYSQTVTIPIFLFHVMRHLFLAPMYSIYLGCIIHILVHHPSPRATCHSSCLLGNWSGLLDQCLEHGHAGCLWPKKWVRIGQYQVSQVSRAY